MKLRNKIRNSVCVDHNPTQTLIKDLKKLQKETVIKDDDEFLKMLNFPFVDLIREPYKSKLN